MKFFSCRLGEGRIRAQNPESRAVQSRISWENHMNCVCHETIPVWTQGKTKWRKKIKKRKVRTTKKNKDVFGKKEKEQKALTTEISTEKNPTYLFL